MAAFKGFWAKEELWQESGFLTCSKGDNDLLLQPTSIKWCQSKPKSGNCLYEREQGLEVLKETQIRSWWSTYHPKRKRSVGVLQEEAAQLQGLHPSQHSVLQQQPVAMSQQQPIPVTQVSAPSTQSQQQPIPVT